MLHHCDCWQPTVVFATSISTALPLAVMTQNRIATMSEYSFDAKFIVH